MKKKTVTTTETIKQKQKNMKEQENKKQNQGSGVTFSWKIIIHVFYHNCIYLSDAQTKSHPHHCTKGKGGERGVVGPLPWIFAVFQYLGEILPLVESL